MWQDELKEFYKHLENNNLLSGVYSAESIIRNFFNQKQSLKTELLNKLSVTPEAIKTQAYDIYDLNKELDELNNTLRILETKTYTDVELTTDLDGKKLFSNETKRKIETDNRLKIDGNYQNIVMKAVNLKKDIDHRRIEADFLNNTLKSSRAICLILGVE